MGDSNSIQSILQSTARWRHSYLLEFLVEKIYWPNDMLKVAFKSAQSKACAGILGKEIGRRGIKVRNMWLCVCFNDGDMQGDMWGGEPRVRDWRGE
jgi:hypothetical protein